MKEIKKVQSINYLTRFHNKNNLLYTQKCDFKVEKNRVDFKTCPIIAEISGMNIQHKFDIDSIISIDVQLSVADKDIPQSLINPQKICAECVLKHRERE